MKDTTISDWLETLGTKSPTPGGGAVAAINVAVAAAQLKMVCEYTTDSKYKEVAEEMKLYASDLEKLTKLSIGLADEDANAFNELSNAYKSKDNETIQNSLYKAAKPPAKVVDIAEKVLSIAEEVIDKGNNNLISDIAVSSSTLRAGIESAIINIEINKASIKDKAKINELTSQVHIAEELIKLADSLTAQVRRKIQEKR